MLQVHQISKSYAIETILEAVTFAINPADRVGLVGPNGSGKSTLLRVITGEEPPDQGTVFLAPGAKLGYLPQGIELNLPNTVGDYIRAGIPGFQEAHRQVDVLAEQMSHDSLPAVLEAYGNALQRFEMLGGYSIESRIDAVLNGLGLREVDQQDQMRHLSGGQRTRVGLARLLVSAPDVLLLDEPTNHLDIPSRQQFETALEGFPGTVLVSVHDRAFIERFATSLWRLKGNQLRKEYLPGG